MAQQEDIVFIKLLPGLKTDPIEVHNVISSGLEHPIKFTACAIWAPRPPAGTSCTLSPELEGMLRELRDQSIPKYLWIEQLCVQSSYEDRARHVPMLKDIFMTAERVVIWSGNDQEPMYDKCFDFYFSLGHSVVGANDEDTKKLGASTATNEEVSIDCLTIREVDAEEAMVNEAAKVNISILESTSTAPTPQEITTHAFNFANRLATASIPEVASVLERRHPTTNIHSWAYLFRILCRPFFRDLPLLQTNYLDQLPLATVRCSSSDIGLAQLRKAAVRIWAIFPIPYFIRETPFLTKDGLNNKFMDNDREFLQSCMRFGFSPPDSWGRIDQAFRQENERTAERGLAHFSFCNDIYRLNERESVYKAERARARSLVDDPERYIAIALAPDGRNLMPPSRQLDDCKLSPPPEVLDQAPFVHFRQTRLDTMLLTKLYPADTLSEPVQCCLVEHKITKAPDILWLTNSTVLRAPLPVSPYFGAQFPVTTRHTAPILVNRQAFIVPRLQEVFMRLMRGSKEPKYLFMWNICMYPSDAIDSKRSISFYTGFKYFLETNGTVFDIDMYTVLDGAVEHLDRSALEEVGLPQGMSWDEWLLEIND